MYQPIADDYSVSVRGNRIFLNDHPEIDVTPI